MKRPLLVLTALGAVAALAGSAGSAPAPAFVAGSTGFHSVLAYGQGQTTSALDLALNLGAGELPTSFTSQAAMYNRVITTRPRGDLQNFYKNSSFAKITGDSESPTAGATVVRDATHRVPHVYGDTRAAAMFAVGWVTAQDRLFLMDVLRRTAQGSTAELLGPSAVPADAATLGQFDRSPAELTAELERLPLDEGAAGARALSDIKQYVAGINAWIQRTRLDPTKLPAEYAALGTLPEDWALSDTAAVGYLLIAQFTVFGDAEHLQADVLARLQKRLGSRHGKGAYDDLRHLEDPKTPVTAHRVFRGDRPRTGSSSAVRLDAGSITPRNAVVSQESPALPPVPDSRPAWATELATRGLQLEHHASNALLVAASHSRSGHALAAMGPQVGYYSPEIVVEYELHAPGVHVSGMSFPGASPLPLIGHTATFAWTGTTTNADNADTFAEQLCEPSGKAPTKRSEHYLYRGRCIAFTHRDQVLHTPMAPAEGTEADPPSTVTLRTMRSVHGPVHDIATSGGRPYALVRSTAVNGRGLRSFVSFVLLAEGHVKTPQQFVAAMRHVTGSENWFFVSDKHIAWLQSGWFPQRAPGTDTDLPIRGTGRWDWLGFNPTTGSFSRHSDAFNPLSIDPEQGYLSSWNNKGAHGWRAAPGVWSYGRVQRDQLLRDPLLAAFKANRKLTLSDVVAISGNASTQDLRALQVLPDLLRVLGTPKDPTQRAVVASLRHWLATGAHRRDTTGKGWYDESAAVLAFDAFWRQAVHRVYDPRLGKDVVTLLQGGIDLVLDRRAVQTGFFDGWHSQLSDVVRAALGTGPRMRATSCGGGSLAGCRALLQAALGSAVSGLVKQHGASPTAWHKPVLCPDDDTPSCDENRPITAGALATPAQPFQNRGTFHQAVEVFAR
ncbi:MAG TPA: penicillin acylase family protein [Mycobacteriales bacterium]|nr:penicillin acylase family protein [Mycobacteriales bacterium]